MGGWANGIAAKELGTHLPGPMIWIGYRDSARYGLTTTLSLKDGAQQIWVEMDAATWRELIAEAEQAIHELWTASIDPEDIERRHPERWARGERVNTAKLTEDQVREIRRRHAAGETTVALGPAFGVSQSLVSLIVRRKCWKHVD